MRDDVNSWRRQANGLSQGWCPSCDIVQPVIRSRRFIYADDVCCAIQAETFSEIECTLAADLAHLAKYCQLWRLKLSTSETVTSVFHLHNNTSRCKLNVHMNGQRLKHNLCSVYLSVALDRTLSYREHLSRSALKPKSRDNLITKLMGCQCKHPPYISLGSMLLSRKILLSSVG